MDLIDRQPEERTDKRAETHACDLVSRQAALKIVAKHIGVDGDRACLIDVGKTYVEIYALPSAQPEQRWIPCSERLPERGIDVLVTRDYDGRADFYKSCRYVEVASRHGEDDDVVWISYSDEYKMSPENHKVIAWMPFPEPWRGEQE